MAVNPQPGLISQVTTGGIAEDAVGPNPNGGIITNPPDSLNYLYVNPVGDATLQATDQTFALAPGQSWSIIPGQTTATSVNAPDNNHKFSVVVW